MNALARAPAFQPQAPVPAQQGLLQRTQRPVAVNEALEQEADRLAHRALSKPAHASMGSQALPFQGNGEPRGGHADARSESTNTAMVSPGNALEPALKLDMEQRFGHDFSRVRVFAGGDASRQAHQLGAQAFACGPNMVFGAGRFAPGSSDGRALLAHELAHVVQQSRPGVEARPLLRPQRSPDVSAPATTPDPLAPARTALAELRRRVTDFARTAPTDLPVTLTELRTSLNNALRVAMGDASRAPLVSDLRQAYSDAVRAALEASRAAGRSAIHDPPSLRSLYEDHRDEIEPFALPIATADSTAQELMAELDTPLSAAPTPEERARHTALATARRQMRVVTSQVTVGLESLFSTAGGTTTIPLPTHATVRFSSGVAAALQRGLRNVAGQILNTPLTANTTLMLALDLRPYGGGYDAYRFTRLDVGTTTAPAVEILVELQGAIGVEGLLAQQRADLLARFTRAGFRRGSGFNTAEFDQVLIGAGEIPESQLSALSGLNFVQEPASATHPTAAAEYDQTTHTVHVFDSAFSSSQTRLGRAGHVLQFAAHTTAHEIGHARDLSSLRTTAAATTAAERALLAEFGTGDRGYTIPDSRDSARARFNELNTPLTTARATERAARSRSGARWGPGSSPGDTEVTDTLPAREATPAFRAAAARDDGPGSPRMPTTYPNPESVLQEYYAESFAMYSSSPDLLRRIRPSVFAYFASESP